MSRPDLIDGPAAALFLSATGRTITPGQIRTWAWRNPALRRGHDWRGRTLYSLAELEQLARDTPEPSRKTRQ